MTDRDWTRPAGRGAPVVGAVWGSLVLLAARTSLARNATASILRRRDAWPSFVTVAAAVACVVAALTLAPDAPAAERGAERPREEILLLERSVVARQQSLDSLLQHIETLPQAALEKSVLESVHALTEELRENRRRLRLLRDSVVPLAVEPAPRPAPRPARPTRPSRPSRGDKVISQGLVRFSEDVEVLTDETVNGDAIVLDGDLVVDGHVEGNAIVVAGNLLLGRRASVNGQAIAIAGRVEKAPGAEVGGQEMSLTLMPGGFAGSWPYWVSLILDLFKLGFLLLVAGLFLAVIPERMARARDQLGESFLKCFGVGLVVLCGGSFALAVGVILLSITFVGIPAALLISFATGVLLIASLFVGVLLVGDRLQESLNFGRRAPWMSVGLGLLFIMLPELLSDAFRFAFVPGSGIAISLFSKGLVLVTVAAGLGAIVLSRLGAIEPGRTPQTSA